MSRAFAVLLALLIAVPTAAQTGTSAPVKLAADIDDLSSNIRSLLLSELRAVSGLRLVSRQDDPELYLRVLVACVPTCRDIDTYNLAVVLSTPSRSTAGAQLAAAILPPTATDSVLIAADSMLSESLAGSERVHQLWMFSWPRSQYELAGREFVRMLDAECIAKLRSISQSVAAFLEGDQAASSSAMRELEGRKWIC